MVRQKPLLFFLSGKTWRKQGFFATSEVNVAEFVIMLLKSYRHSVNRKTEFFSPGFFRSLKGILPVV